MALVVGETIARVMGWMMLIGLAGGRSKRRIGEGKRSRRRRIYTHGGWRFCSAGGRLEGERLCDRRLGEVGNGKCYGSCQVSIVLILISGNFHIGTGSQGRKRASGRRQRQRTRDLPPHH